MNGTTIVEFDEPFKFSLGGEYHETSQITVRAPGLGKANVHFAMEAYVSEMAMWYAKEQARFATETSDPNRLDTTPVGVEEDDEAAKGPEPTVKERAESAIQTMAMALGPERYPSFAGYVQKTLTANKRLATVGESETPITEEVWVNMAEANGMPGVSLVLGAFTDFFVSALEEPRESGKSKPRKSSSSTKVRSRTTK